MKEKEFLTRTRLPVFVPRSDLEAEQLNHLVEVFIESINELAGRLNIIRLEIPEEDREKFAEEVSYPILNSLTRLKTEMEESWSIIFKNKEEADETLDLLDTYIKEIERRLNSLDDNAALKSDLALMLDRIQYIKDNMVPQIIDGRWHIGKTDTGVKAKGESVLMFGSLDSVDDLPAIGSIGEAWMVGTTEEKEMYLWDNVREVWVNQGPLRGPAGSDGAQGVPGKDGEDGQVLYTWIRYADDENGTGISNDPTGKAYIGFAYNKLSSSESNNPNEYLWSKITGEDGVPGLDGEDGTEYFTWIKYSDDGIGMYDQPKATTFYIGIAINQTTAEESDDPLDYTWSLFRGTDGEKGKGIEEIVNYYQVSSSNEIAPNKWLTTIPNLTIINKYLWNYEKIVYDDGDFIETPAGVIGVYGDKGADGLQGEPGVDGQSQYTHIRYSKNSDGTSMTPTPQSNTEYIGLAVTNNSTGPTSKGDYVWSKIKGEDGQAGIDGISGVDGTSYYTWIKYADTPTSGMSDSPGDKNYIGIAHNKTTDVESNDYADYQWSLLRGSDGSTFWTTTTAPVHPRYTFTITNLTGPDTDIKVGDLILYSYYRYTVTSVEESVVLAPTRVSIRGATGAAGSAGEDGRGIESIEEWYAVHTSNTTPPTTGWSKTPQITNTVNKYLWNYEVITYTEGDPTETAKKVIGTHGDTGPQGPQGIPGEPGEDGSVTYTWIRYADTSTGSGISNNPTGKKYIGLAYNKATATESNIASDYKWSKFIGEDGIPGAKGADGHTLYTWIKYSDDKVTMYDIPTATTEYIGIAVNKTTATESNKVGDYTWSKFKGETGTSVNTIKTQYYASDSDEETTGGSWVYVVPAIEDEKYLWSRTEITYKNPVSIEYTVEKLEVSWEHLLKLQEELDGTKEDLSDTNDYIGSVDGKIDIVTNDIESITVRVEKTEEDLIGVDTFISETTQTIDGLTQSISKKGGNNLLENSVKQFGTSHWRGNWVNIYTTATKQNLGSPGALLSTDEDDEYDTLVVPNGTYIVSYKYKKTKAGVNEIKVNEYTQTLTDMNKWVDGFKVFEVLDNQIKLTLTSDTNGSIMIGDVGIYPGDIVAPWSPNPNELYTGTVSIGGDSIGIESSAMRTKFVASPDGIRIFRIDEQGKPQEEVVEFTEYGSKQKEMHAQETNVSGLVTKRITDDIVGSVMT